MSAMSPEVKGALGELDKYIEKVEDLQDTLVQISPDHGIDNKVIVDVTLGQMLLQAEEMKEDITMHPMKAQENIKDIQNGIRRNSDELAKSFDIDEVGLNNNNPQ